VDVRDLPTPHGPARAHLRHAERPRAALLLGHGAGGSLAARDLQAVAARAVELR
jgi:predicted alpha/beta-hydrolase family hydrolase